MANVRLEEDEYMEVRGDILGRMSCDHMGEERGNEVLMMEKVI